MRFSGSPSPSKCRHYMCMPPWGCCCCRSLSPPESSWTIDFTSHHKKLDNFTMYRSQIEGNSLRLCFKWSVAVSFGDTYDNFLGCHSKRRLAACCQMGLKSGIETQIQRHVCSVTRVEENCSTVDVDAQCGRTGFAFQPLQQNVNSRRRVDAVSPARAP